MRGGKKAEGGKIKKQAHGSRRKVKTVEGGKKDEGGKVIGIRKWECGNKRLKKRITNPPADCKHRTRNTESSYGGQVSKEGILPVVSFCVERSL